VLLSTGGGILSTIAVRLVRLVRSGGAGFVPFLFPRRRSPPSPGRWLTRATRNCEQHPHGLAWRASSCGYRDGGRSTKYDRTCLRSGRVQIPPRHKVHQRVSANRYEVNHGVMSASQGALSVEFLASYSCTSRLGASGRTGRHDSPRCANHHWPMRWKSPSNSAPPEPHTDSVGARSVTASPLSRINWTHHPPLTRTTA